jgi:chromosome segregation protein
VRLNSIKLSGFKSFAEPTNFLLPGQLVGVVGPNGCGKSNVMDAVRWVLGESKASELRGESMQDVIFNGTTTRKAANRASVELVFSNEDHRAGGQWNQFAEIAVRRVLTREGNSSYLINNQVVRRRDVQDVFLGTGLGPRAYAIIGQGTISRIIESKPEELRLFLEEAAGVSKYKERRRETETRLKDTRDNLTRVQDILRELTANLDKLEKQAEVAKKFKAMSAAATQKQQQLWFLKRQDVQRDAEQSLAAVLQAQNALEARVADLRHIESELETIRQAHYSAGDQVNQAQGKLYEASSEVGRLEAEIRFVVDGRLRVQQRLQNLQVQAQQWATRLHDAHDGLAQLTELSALGQEQSELLDAQMHEQAQALPDLEAIWREQQNKVQNQHASVLGVQQQIGVLAAEQRSLQEQTRQLETRRERLLHDQRALQAPDEQRLQALQAQLAQAQQSVIQTQAQHQALSDSTPALQAQWREQQQTHTHEAAQLTALSARLEALKALQNRVKTDDKLKPWLEKHGLDHLPGLWTRLHVEAGWENAIEAALRERMGALQVSRLEMLSAFAQDLPAAKLAFFQPLVLADAPAEPSARLTPLSSWLRLQDAELLVILQDWLQTSFSASNLQEAMASRSQLRAGEMIYVPSGHAVSRQSVSFYAQDSAQSGLLARAQEIENLEKLRRAQMLIADTARTALLHSESLVADMAKQVQAAQREASLAQTQAHALQVQTLQLTQLAEQARLRLLQMNHAIAELDEQLQTLQERRVMSEASFEELDWQLAQAQEIHREWQDQVQLAERQLNECREQQRRLERQLQEANFSLRTLDARRAEFSRAIETAVHQASSVSAETELAQQELLRLDDASAQAGLQQALAFKLEREQLLASGRSHYDDLTLKLRASDERRLQLEHAMEPLRRRITELQLKEQAARLGFEQYTQLLLDAKADLSALAMSLAEGSVRLGGLQNEIDRLQDEIAALGAVNLAALDELSATGERKQFLDSQSADLTEAMNTLEDAIRKIDAETRSMLGDTFAAVNGHFGRMFPELFGGGNARLEMTGGEILDAGVQVIAQPPGKKNQSIALLSGGEKALTAIALVFAIFQLNPAPFCLLDEVDAPLDDANTERYAKLVTAMSRETQFLFISHNKIAMEMAEQLIGVTMQEQGVSRIVAVDMEAALSLNTFE